MLEPAVQSPSATSPVTPPTPFSPDPWRSYHLFYHGDHDLQLRHLVEPLVRRLILSGDIDRFYFIRYRLGGPHLRLRWRTTSPLRAEQALAAACEAFFQQHPAPSILDDAQVRADNQGVISNDPLSSAADDQVFPNHSWKGFANHFEVERYGGDLRFDAALEGFCLSSLFAMRLVSRTASLPPSRRRSHWLRALASFAWGLAADEDEFQALLAYGPRFMGPDFDCCREPGNTLFDRRSDAFTALLRMEMTRPMLDDTTADDRLLFSSGRHLAATVADLKADDRWYVIASHLHMAANRLGLNNAEEVYLSQTLSRAGDRLRSRQPEIWRHLVHNRPQPSRMEGRTPAADALQRWTADGGRDAR